MFSAALAPLPWEKMALSTVVLVLRVVSVLLAAPVPALAAVLARRVGASPTVASVSAWLPLAVPGAARAASTAGPDGMQMTLVGVALVLLVRLAVDRRRSADSRAWSTLAAGLAVGAACSVKGTALPLAVLLPAVAAWGRRPLSLRALRAGAGLVGAAAMAGPWWALSLWRSGTVQPRGLTEEQTLAQYGVVPRGSAAAALRQWSALVTTRTWGTDPAHLPRSVIIAGTLVLAGLIATSTAAVRPRLVSLVLLTPAVAVLASAFASAVVHWRTFGGVTAAQGRYVFVDTAGLSATTALGLGALAGRWRAWIVTLAPLTALASVALVLSAGGDWWGSGVTLGGMGPNATGHAWSEASDLPLALLRTPTLVLPVMVLLGATALAWATRARGRSPTGTWAGADAAGSQGSLWSSPSSVADVAAGSSVTVGASASARAAGAAGPDMALGPPSKTGSTPPDSC